MAAHLPRPCAVSRVGAAVTSFSANQRWKPAVPWAGEPTTAPPIPSVHWSKMTSADLSTESHGSRTRPFQRGAVVFAPSSRADTASGHATVNPPAPPHPVVPRRPMFSSWKRLLVESVPIAGFSLLANRQSVLPRAPSHRRRALEAGAVFGHFFAIEREIFKVARFRGIHHLRRNRLAPEGRPVRAKKSREIRRIGRRFGHQNGACQNVDC